MAKKQAPSRRGTIAAAAGGTYDSRRCPMPYLIIFLMLFLLGLLVACVIT
ncbi:MAG: hypothetical protein ACLQJR_08595 [Stellaceae bacterium]